MNTIFIIFSISALGLVALVYLKTLNRVILRDSSVDHMPYNPNWFTIDYKGVEDFISKKSGDFFAHWIHKLLLSSSGFIVQSADNIAKKSHRLASKVEERINRGNK